MAVNDHANTGTTSTTNDVFRVHSYLTDTGLPMSTGFESDFSFETEAEAESLARRVEANPGQFFEQLDENSDVRASITVDHRRAYEQ